MAIVKLKKIYYNRRRRFMAEKLKMKDDILFKLFFSRNQNNLKSFLGAILGNDIKIAKVIHDARLEQLVKEMKYGILDLEVELETGEIVNVEMQLKDYKNIEQRTTFYASKKIVEQLEPKQDYSKLKKVIIIAILDYSITDLPEYLLETIRIIRGHNDYELNNEEKYYYIELDKFRKQNPDMSNILNQWLAFIDMERRDLLEMAMKENKEIEEAVEKYEVLTGDEEVKRLAEIRLMSKLEENAALASARAKGTEMGLKQGKEEGLKQGKEEGLKQGKEEIKKIINKLAKMDLTEEQIKEATGLTINEIRQILKDK